MAHGRRIPARRFGFVCVKLLMVLRISYESDSFPPGSIANGGGTLAVTWDDILWAAVTVGRPNRHYVFQHGTASMYEALFRWSLVRMAIEQSGHAAFRLRRTAAFMSLDPTEKGAVSYFLGMTFCKLFSAKLLDAPWLLHLDVFRDSLNASWLGRSRPDLIGQVTNQNTWHAFESKGRASVPDLVTKTKAKAQAQRLISVNGIACTLHIGAISFFRNDALHFYWRDPEPERLRPIEIPEIGDAWRYYYSPIADLLAQRDPIGMFEQENAFVPITEADIEVSVHPTIARVIFQSQWQRAREIASELAQQFLEAGYQPDGLRIRAGDSWKRRFKDEWSEAEAG